MPLVVLAQSGATAKTAENAGTFLGRVSSIFSLLVPIFITLAVLYFFWGLIEYLMGGADKKEEGRSIMIWGIVVIFIMVSVFGIVQLLANTFGLGLGTTIQTPVVPSVPF